MITSFDAFQYNEKLGISKDQIEKALSVIKRKMPFETFVSYIKKYKNKIIWVIKKFTNGKDKIDINNVYSFFSKNEGFKDSSFYEIFIEPFTRGGEWIERGLSITLWLVSIFIGFMIYLLGVFIYMNVFYTPMDVGVVSDVKFVEEYTNTYTTYVHVGDVTVPITNTVDIPDTYYVEVRELNGGDTETWSTTDIEEGSQYAVGDTLNWNEDVFSVAEMK